METKSNGMNSLPSASYAPSLASERAVEGNFLDNCSQSVGQKRIHEGRVVEVPKLSKYKDRIAQQIFDATLVLGRNERHDFQLQIGLPKLDLVSDLFKLPVLGRLAHIEDAMQNDAVSRQAAIGPVVPMPFAQRRLLTAKLAKSDDALLTSALRKLRSLVLYWPEDSRLGRTLISAAGAIVGEDILQQSIKDCFAGKAVATLVKRSADYTRFAEWMLKTGRGRPAQPD